MPDDGLDVETWYPDADLDGFGDATAEGLETCDPPEEGTLDASDCNDGDATVNPAASEVPDDGVDQDCDGSDLVTPIEDRDGDGIPDAIDPDPDSAGDQLDRLLDP